MLNRCKASSKKTTSEVKQNADRGCRQSRLKTDKAHDKRGAGTNKIKYAKPILHMQSLCVINAQNLRAKDRSWNTLIALTLDDAFPLELVRVIQTLLTRPTCMQQCADIRVSACKQKVEAKASRTLAGRMKQTAHASSPVISVDRIPQGVGSTSLYVCPSRAKS